MSSKLTIKTSKGPQFDVILVSLILTSVHSPTMVLMLLLTVNVVIKHRKPLIEVATGGAL